MSRIPDLGENNENLIEIVQEYDDALDDAKDNLRIKGKTLKAANMEQASWQSFYDQRKNELHTLVKYFENEVQRVRGKLFVGLTKNNARDLSDRAKDKFIDSEAAYLTMYSLYLEIKELYDQYQSVVDAFKSRGFVLNNLTKLKTSAMEDDVL